MATRRVVENSSGKDKIQKIWAYLGIILMLVLNFGPFFNYLKFPERAQANASTTWTKSGSNPVINSTQAGYPRVIKVGSTYKAWVEENGTSNVRYASSSDGISWSALQAITDLGASTFASHEASVIYDSDDSLYKMWYNGFDQGTFTTYTGYRTSTDGITNWSNEVRVSYNVTKAWDGDRITPYVFKDASTYRMYYNANEGNGKYYIAYATSSNGTSWTEPQDLGQVTDVASGTTNNNLVLKQGSTGTWEGFQGGEAMYSVCVLKNTSNTYEMWYAANQNSYGVYPYYQIGYATSSNPTNFTTSTKYAGNPVLSIGASGWDSTGVLYPNVILDGSTYKMWYTNNWSGNVGYATAPAETVTPQTATVTAPVNGTYYNAATIPSQFSGAAADGVGGTGLNANSTQFYLKRASDNYYWNGTEWTVNETWSYSVQAETNNDTEVAWNSITAMPSWVSGETYTTQSKVTNKAANTKTSSLVTFYYDNQDPVTATVTTPTNGATYNSATMPATFSGSVADHSSGLGLNANSAKFYLKVISGPTTYYWTGSSWSEDLTWVNTTHDVTSGGATVTWQDNIDFPTWDNNTYYVKAKATSKSGKTLEGTEISFAYNNAAPATISDLAVSSDNLDPKSLVLNWTAPAKATGGAVTSYVVKYSTSTITAINFDAATTATVVPTPSTPGQSQQMTITGLSVSTKYYFAVKSYDSGAGLYSAISNLPDGTTTGFFGFTTQTVDSTGIVGTYSSIATDSTNFSHISYYDQTNGDLEYATNSSGSWVTTTIDSEGNVGSSNAIAVDPNNYPHIAYYDSSNANLKYAYKDGTGWHTSTIDSEGDRGSDPSIVLDSNGKVHISFYDATDGDLMYITNQTGSWITTVFESADNNGQFSSIDVDSSNHAHIAYIDYTHYYLKYVYYNGTDWTYETVDNNGQIGWDLTLKIDSNNKPHIGYYNYILQELKYADKTGASWVIETVDSTGEVGKNLDMVLNYNNIPYFSYYKFAGDGGFATPHNQVRYLKLAYMNDHGDGTHDWVSAFIDSSIAPDGEYPYEFSSGIALTTDGKARMSYYNVTDKDLKFAYDYTTGGTSVVNMNDFYKSSNWTEASSINGYASGVSLDQVQIKIQRLSDSYYWNGAAFVEADPGWQNATNTNSWTYSFAASNFTNAVGYTVSTRAHDSNGYGSSSSHSFMYNSLNWKQYRINPILWSNNAYYPVGIKEGSTYKGWYAAYSGGKYKIYYATSTNGINWSDGNSGSPVFTGAAGTWNANIFEPWVVKDGSTYKMWYAGYNTDINVIKIGYATSSDGISWTNYGSSPVLDVGSSGQWDDKSLRKAVVVKDGSAYKMWYSGTQGDNTAYNIGYATSSDGISWTKSGSNPVLQRGSQTTDWDYSNIWAISVIKRGTAYELYYTGNGALGQPDNNHKIGYAFSADGTSWNKYSSNPVMTHGSSGSWNEAYVWAPSLLVDSLDGATYYRMWYDGTDDDNLTQVGYATLDAPADTTDPTSSPAFDSDVSILAMSKVGSTYYAGPLFWDIWTAAGINPLLGTAYDWWGIEKVQLTFKGDDNKYWDGDSWESSETWLNSSSDDDYQNWDYQFTSNNFTNARTYTLTSKATDGSGDVSGRVQSSPSSQLFTWDNVKPEAALTQIGGATPKTYYNSDLFSIVSGTASDATSGVYEVDLALKRSSDGKYWRYATEAWETSRYYDDATGTTSWSYADIRDSLKNSIRSAGDGITYTIYTFGIDNVYNNADFSSSTTTQFVYDGTAPTSSPSLSRSYYNASNWPGTISGTASDATSGVASVQVKIKNTTDNIWWTGSEWGAETWLSATGTTSWSYVLAASNLTSGKSYTVYSRATDNAENVQSSLGSVSFGYDTATPTTPTVYDGATEGVETSEVESLTTLSANWTAAASGGGSDISYEYAIDSTQGGTDIVSWTSTGTARSVTKSDLSLSLDQTYYFSVRATNGAGATGTAGNSSGQTVVDHTPPVVSLTTYPSDPTSNSTPTFAGTSIDAMSNISTVEYKADNGSWTTIWSEAQTGNRSKSINFSYAASALSNGRHTAYFQSTDAKNNTSSAISYSFTVDTIAPSSPNITYPSSGEIISDHTPTFIGTSEANATILLTISSDTKSYLTTANSSGDWSYTMPDSDALDDGDHSLEAKARDSAGNTSGAANISFTVKTKTASSARVGLAATPAAIEAKKPEVTVTSDQIDIPVTTALQNVKVLLGSQFSLNIKPLLEKEINSVTANFEGSTYQLSLQSNGFYSANIFAPNLKGTYAVKATIIYKDGATEEVDVNILVDPYGYVYEKNKAGEQHLEGAIVTLYVYKDNKWIIWDGANYNNQKNPQTTLANGEYGFMVPEGKYYLLVEKDGYKNSKSAEIKVDKGQPINLNIELTQKTNYWIWIIAGLLLVVLGIVYYYFRKKR